MSVGWSPFGVFSGGTIVSAQIFRATCILNAGTIFSAKVTQGLDCLPPRVLDHEENFNCRSQQEIFTSVGDFGATV
jgi:hypothetical protein